MAVVNTLFGLNLFKIYWLVHSILTAIYTFFHWKEQASENERQRINSETHLCGVVVTFLFLLEKVLQNNFYASTMANKISYVYMCVIGDVSESSD